LPFPPFLRIFSLLEILTTGGSAVNDSILGFRGKIEILYLLFLLGGTVFVTAQQRAPGGDMQNRVTSVTFEAVSLFSPDTGKAFVNIHYRIPRSYFVFVKQSASGGSKEEYLGRGQLVVELIDDKSVSVAREIRPIALMRSSLASNNEPQGDIEGAISFNVVKGEFHIIFEVDDLESGRTFVDKKRSVNARNTTPKPLDVSTPFFATIDRSQPSSLRYTIFNHGNSIPYGDSRGGLVAQLHCPHSDSALTVRWNLHGESEDRNQQTQDLSGTAFELVDGLLELSSKEGPVIYTARSSPAEWKIIFVPVPLERLEPGRYNAKLFLSYGKEKVDHETMFQVIWPNRPMSLTDWDMATEALRYIATPEEMESIQSSPSTTGLQSFRAFWKKKDPDTTSAYNEVMVEYYRRVDEANRRYSTTKELDGYKTDRGRIFVLFGPPTSVDRSLLPNRPPREIWTYQNLRKQFLFVEQNKSGNYILTQTNDL
jgi:GWxTD domain-containing protein